MICLQRRYTYGQQAHKKMFNIISHVVIVLLLSGVQLFCDPMERQAARLLLSVGFPRQEYRSRLPFPSPEDFPDPEIKPTTPALAGRFFTIKPPGKPLLIMRKMQIKTTKRYHSTPLRTAFTKTKTKQNEKQK